jgi:ParB family chromosome partitioning protein
MPRNQTKTPLVLAGFEDIFNASTPQNGEYVQSLLLTDLREPDPHPFAVRDDESMTILVESIQQYGVREPGLARPHPDGGYELLCGNRRKRACELAGFTEMPVIVRELTNEQAILAMVDSNLQQRETILPSEKAWAYRCRMEALNHNGIKAERHSHDIMAEQTGESMAQIFRFIRLTELLETLLDMVDAKQLAFNPAVELSHLSYCEQRVVLECMGKYEIRPSLSQAVRMKKLKKAGTLTPEMIDDILSEAKGQTGSEPKEDKTLRRFKRFFPEDYTPKQIEAVISDLLRSWQLSQRAEVC